MQREWLTTRQPHNGKSRAHPWLGKAIELQWPEQRVRTLQGTVPCSPTPVTSEQELVDPTSAAGCEEAWSLQT